MDWSDRQPYPPRSLRERTRRRRVPPDYRFWPTQVLDQLMVVLLVVALLATAAVLAPIRPLGPADPLAQPEAVKPQWYFLPLHQLTHYLPGGLALVLALLAGVLVLLWPFLEPSLVRLFGSQVYRRLGLLVLAALLLLGLLGLISDRSLVILGKQVHFNSWGLPGPAPVEEADLAVPVAPPTAPSRPGPRDAPMPP